MTACVDNRSASRSPPRVAVAEEVAFRLCNDVVNCLADRSFAKLHACAVRALKLMVTVSILVTTGIGVLINDKSIWELSPGRETSSLAAMAATKLRQFYRGAQLPVNECLSLPGVRVARPLGGFSGRAFLSNVVDVVAESEKVEPTAASRTLMTMHELAVGDSDEISFGQIFCRMRRRAASAAPVDPGEQVASQAPSTQGTPAPLTPSGSVEEPPPSPFPFDLPTPPVSAPPMSPLSMSPMMVVSDDEQYRRDEALRLLRRERLAVEYGLLVTDDDGNQVLSNRSDGRGTESGVRRRRGPMSPQATEIDSESTERLTPSGGDDLESDSGVSYESVCSSPPWYSPTIVDGSPSNGSFVSSSYSSHMLHAGARRRRRGVVTSPEN